MAWSVQLGHIHTCMHACVQQRLDRKACSAGCSAALKNNTSGSSTQSFKHAALTAPLPPAPQVAREDHFAAVKNAPGSATDSPDTARAALLAQGGRWVAAAGGQLAAGCEGVEVSPLVSYAGEGLQELVQGNTLQVC